MKTLFLFAFRELRRSRLRVALVLLVLTVQSASLGGGLLAQRSLEADRTRWETLLRLADLTVSFVPASDEEMPSIEELRAIPGVKAVSRRFTSIGRIDRARAGVPPLPVVVHYIDPGAHPDVSDVALLEGRWFAPDHPEEAIVERSYAIAHGVGVGDEIVLDPHRMATRFRVVGIGLSPEYLVPTANPEQLVPHKGSLGVLFASRAALDRVFVDRLYDEALFTFEPNADRAASTAAVLQRFADRHVEVERVTPKETAFAHRYVDVLLSAGDIVTPFVSAILALLAAIAIVVTVSRLAVERRKELAVLLAQGTAPSAIARAFAGIGLIGGWAGAIAGVPGALAFAWASARTTADIAGLPPPPLHLSVGSLGAIAIGSGSAIATAALATLLAALPLLRVRPADALRGRADVAVGARLPAFGAPAVRYATRNVGRRPRLSVSVILLVALAAAQPAALLTTLTSWTTWSDRYAHGFAWDANVAFRTPLAEDDAAALLRGHGIVAFETYVQGYAGLTRASGRSEAVRLRGVPVPAVLANVQLSSGRVFSSDDADEAVMNEGFRPNGDAPRLGERIVVESGGRTRALVVVGLVRDASLATVLAPAVTARALLGKDGRASGAHVLLGPEGERALTLDESVGSVQTKERFAIETARYLDAFTATLVPFIVLSSILAFAFVGGVLGILLGERAAEHATLRALGAGPRRIFGVIAVEIGLLVGAGGVVTLLLWMVLAHVLRVPIAHAWFEIAVDLRLRDVAIPVVPILLFAMVATIPATRRVLGLDLAQTLRAR